MIFAVRTACPAGFTIRNEHYNSCYMLVGVYLTWFDAESYCYSNGAHLVAFETADELDYIMGEIDSQSSTGNIANTVASNIFISIVIILIKSYMSNFCMVHPI